MPVAWCGARQALTRAAFDLFDLDCCIQAFKMPVSCCGARR